MRFMMLVKHAQELSGPPPQALMNAMEKLTAEANRAGTMVTGGGLAPVAASTQVRVANGKRTTIDGPFTESKEIVGGFAIFDLVQTGGHRRGGKIHGTASPALARLGRNNGGSANFRAGRFRAAVQVIREKVIASSTKLKTGEEK